MFKDYYGILGVSPSASQEEIDKAKREWNATLHESRIARLPEAAKRHLEEQLKDINEAYGVISDPEQRRNYDRETTERRREHEREQAEEKAKTDKKAEYALIRDLFKSGDIEGAVTAAKSLYSRFPDDTDCQNNYAALLYEWAKHLSEKGKLKEAGAQLRQAVEHALDETLKARILADLELLRAIGIGDSPPRPSHMPPRPADAVSAPPHTPAESVDTVPPPPTARANSKVVAMWLIIAFWSLGAIFAAAPFFGRRSEGSAQRPETSPPTARFDDEKTRQVTARKPQSHPDNIERRPRAPRPGQSASKEAMTYFWRAETDCQQRDFDKAIANCSKAIALNPAFAKAYAYRGRAFEGKDDADNAIADCSKAIELNPSDYEGYYNRGLTYYRTKDYDKAIADFSKAVELEPKNPWPHLYRGLTYNEKGDSEKAWTDVKQCQALGGTVNQKHLDKLQKPTGSQTADTTSVDRKPTAAISTKAKEAAPSGYIPFLNAHVTHLLFFEFAGNIPSRVQRTYSHVFSRARTRMIGCELGLSFPAKARQVNFDIDWTWYGPSGSILFTRTHHCNVKAGWEKCTPIFSHGRENPDHFEPGNYRVDLFVQGEKVASGSFAVSTEDTLRDGQPEDVNARYRASATPGQNLHNAPALNLELRNDYVPKPLQSDSSNPTAVLKMQAVPSQKVVAENTARTSHADSRASAERASMPHQAMWRGQIVKVEGSKIFINAGANFGVKLGDRFTCIHPGQMLIDRYTRQNLVRKEMKYGLVEVVEVLDKCSIAKPVAGIGFTFKDIIVSEDAARLPR